MRKYIVATRPSLLAYTQTEQTVNLLRDKNPDCEFEIVRFSTYGDIMQDKPLTSFGVKGVFVKELENAILAGKADFAVHSLKDVPGVQPEGLALVSFPDREDARDVLLTNNNISINDLPDDCVIGTGSPRRILQLKNLKPNARFKDIRGNIDTRIQKLHNGEFDAIVVAAAGLKRLGKTIPTDAFLDFSISVPAIGQGVIALECKSDDKDLIELLRSINDRNTELAVLAERSFMKTIGVGCKFPVGAYATVNNDIITLETMIGNQNTCNFVRLSEKDTLKNAEELGKRTALNIISECVKRGILIEK